MTAPIRLSTGVAGLDDMTGGGLLRGDATLVAGSPGTGKTTLGMHYLVAGIKAGEPGVLVTFEYLPQQIYRDAAQRGWDFPAWERQGLLRVICTTPHILLAESTAGQSVLDAAVSEIGAQRLVIDSVNHFEAVRTAEASLRVELAGMLNHLRLGGVTPLLTYEIPDIMGPTIRVSRPGLEFLADAVILLRYVEYDGELHKAVNVLKFRGSDHDRRYRRYTMTSAGIRVGDSYQGLENISSGSARRTLSERARELV